MSKVAPRTVALLALACFSARVQAHIPVVHGRLIDLVQRSDLIVIGTAGDVRQGAGKSDTDVAVDAVITGHAAGATLTVHGPGAFAPGQRYVFFLRHTAAGVENVAPAGSVFPALPGPDAVYRQTILAVVQALRATGEARVHALRAALIPALSASATELRYHAALELAALSHGEHALSSEERAALAALQAAQTTDPAIKPLLTAALQPSG